MEAYKRATSGGFILIKRVLDRRPFLCPILTLHFHGIFHGANSNKAPISGDIYLKQQELPVKTSKTFFVP